MNLTKLKELYPKIEIIIDSSTELFDEYIQSFKDSDFAKPTYWEEGTVTIKVILCGKEMISALRPNNTKTIEKKLSEMIQYLIFDKSRKS